MNNNKIEITRELAESLMNGAEAMGWSLAEELRALLAKPAAQRHGEPVAPYAWAYEWAGWISTEGPKDFKACIDREAPPQWAIESGQARNVIKLYTEQSAPIAVVLPEYRFIPAEIPLSEFSLSRGWNACLDEFKRLNP